MEQIMITAASFGLSQATGDPAWGGAVLTALAEAVYIVDTDGRMVWVNAAFERLTGYTLAEVYGQPSTRYYVPEAEMLFAARRRLVQQGKPVAPTVDAVLIRHDGIPVPVELSVSSLIRDGRLVGRLTILYVRPRAAGTIGVGPREGSWAIALPPSTENTETPVALAVHRGWRHRTWRWLPLLVGVGGVAATLVVWQALQRHEHQQIRQTTATAAISVQHEIRARLDARVLALVRMARQWEQWGQPAEEEWVFWAELNVAHFPGYQALGWVDSTWRLRWLAPLAGNEAALGLDAGANPHRRVALEAARDQQAVTATHLFPLAQGGTGFAVYVPLFPQAGFAGVLSASFRAQDLFDTLLADLVPGYGLTLRVGDEVLYQRVPITLSDRAHWQHEREIVLYSVPWHLQVWPLPTSPAREHSMLPAVVLGGGLSLSLALALVLALLYRTRALNHELDQRVQARTTALQALTTTLEQRVVERTAALEHAMVEQQRLEQEARRAEHFSLLGRLAAGVSHELRNPLAAVFLHVDLLEEELQQPSPNSTAEIAESLAEIKTNLARVDDLMQDYLTLVRVGNLHYEVQDLGRVAFHTSTLRRALLNLVQNAADAMPQGGTITLAGQATATHVQLQVQDTGYGIPSERLAQIFEPLYTTKPGGTGLGLYIVQEIVRAHKGQITVASVEGKGTTFTLTLPCATDKAVVQDNASAS